MLLQRSRLSAASLERPRLVQPWLLLTLGGLTVIVLMAIFPFQTLVERVVATQRGDPLTTSYLRNLLRTDPDNPELRLSLARQQGAAGDAAAARRTLAPLIASPDPALRREALWTAWLIASRELDRNRGDASAREQRKRDLLLQLERIAGEDWHESALTELSAQALQLGDLKLAVGLQRKLEERGRKLDAGWFARVAQLALGHGDYRQAAQLYLDARRRATSGSERREYFFAAVGALQSGNLPQEAVQFADANLGELSQDQDALYRMVELARAANRLDLAEKYVRLLLKLSLLQQLLPPEVAAVRDFRVVRAAAPAAAAPNAPPGGPQLPFDDKIYSLGYDVFLANRKLEDAYQVAAAAVRQAPENAAWRLKLARVAEWTQRPAEALTHWHWLAQRQGSDEAWQAVLRLAPGLFDDAALLTALQYQLTRQRADARQIRELVALYERMGDPQGGLTMLGRLYATQPSTELLEAMAQLAERAGDDDRAIGYWRRAIASDGATRERAVHLASLLVARGDIAGAFRLLQQAKGQAGDDAEFWRFYAELAHLSQEDESALLAYEKLIAGGKAGEGDYAALLGLLRDVNPLRAARLAEGMWRQFGRLAFYLQALGLWVGEAQWVEAGRLLAALPRSQLAEAEQTLDFLRLRAQYYQHTGQVRLARHDMERALALAPDDAALREALLWQAIDSSDPRRLRALLARHEAAWSRDAGLHDALAAAHQALSQTRIALVRYLTPHLQAHRNDFLWLMNYADALEQDGAPDRAWRLRQHLWRQARPPAFVVGERELAAVRRVARARLAAAQRPGDAQLVLLRELVALDRKEGGSLSPAVKEMVTAWLQNAGEYTAVRGFLWQQYARDLSKPLWAEITAALALDDRADIAGLLERHGERLPRSDRINAALRVGDAALAQTYAFDSQEVQPDDDAIHQQLAEVLLGGADRAQLAFNRRQVGELNEREAAFGLGLGLATDLGLSLDLGRIGRSSSNDSTITNVPPVERHVQAELAWRHGDGETRLALGWRDSFAAFQPIALQRDQNIDQRLGLTLRLGHHLPAPESAALRVAGMRDLFGVAARYQISRIDRLAAEWNRSRYYGQTGTGFGNGDQWNAEYAHALRSELPDLQVSAFISGSTFNGDDGASDAALGTLVPGGGPATAAFFIPAGSRLWGLRLSSDVRLRQDYTRALQPLFSAALTRSGTLGAGYDLLFGIAGSILGNDHFQIGWSLTKGGSAAFNRTRDVGLSYRLYF